MISENKLYELGNKVGLRKKEVDEIIKKVSDTQLNDSTTRSLQHPIKAYWNATYGTISIDDFQ